MAAAADEVARLAERDDAAEAGLHREGVQPEFVAVERHAGLEAQGVAAGESCRDEAVLPPAAVSACQSRCGSIRAGRRARSRPRRCSRCAPTSSGSALEEARRCVR